MRRISVLLLCLCLLLSGCGKTPFPPPEPVLPAVEAPQIQEKPETAVPPPAEESPSSEQPPLAEPEPAAVPTPIAEPEPKQPACTISIGCKAALECEHLSPSLRQRLPADGWLLPPTEVTVTPGESVFDVLLRVTRQREIAMEFVDAAVYGSAYIEGIGHLYEFDCGGQSGWIYKVNGESPNVGCSDYPVSAGDVIAWEYIVERA